MYVGSGIDQLGVDADLVARSTYTAFEHVAHCQFAPDLLGIDPLALIGERGIA
jgi:hypothetical protein